MALPQVDLEAQQQLFGPFGRRKGVVLCMFLVVPLLLLAMLAHSKLNGGGGAAGRYLIRLGGAGGQGRANTTSILEQLWPEFHEGKDHGGGPPCLGRRIMHPLQR